MLRRPTTVTRRRVAAHACPECRRLWALSGSRIPSGAWVIACKFCGWHDVRGGARTTTSAAEGSEHRAGSATGTGTGTGTGAPTPAPTDARSHDVVFHAADDELVASMAQYLAEGWAAGGIGLVIATPEHRAALRRRLVADGLGESLGGGRYIELDAARTLEQLVDDDGAPDPERFDRTVGSLVRDHAADAPLRGFGEMVDLLWAAGDAVGALELEELWTGLQGRVPFTLLCAYAGAHVGPADRGTIGRAHDHVTAAG